MRSLKIRIEYESVDGPVAAEYEDFGDTPDLYASRISRAIGAGQGVTIQYVDKRVIVPANRVLNVAVDYA